MSLLTLSTATTQQVTRADHGFAGPKSGRPIAPANTAPFSHAAGQRNLSLPPRNAPAYRTSRSAGCAAAIAAHHGQTWTHWRADRVHDQCGTLRRR
ncbi:hypothetical protein [Nocardia sp. CA-119907]|uniref:hypothetical protein n=1 Tax=Nocardia sp. CA-119907 TaxID=3239973 RepID=UPI003D968809